MARAKPVIPLERIASRIYLIKGEKVMLDSDLADLYGVPTSALNQQVRRNADHFPEDFACLVAEWAGCSHGREDWGCE
jgi:ORF6N domain